MTNYDGSWDTNFPTIMHFVNLENAYARPWKLIEAHSDYEAAKRNEDRAAAMRLVHDFLNTPENQNQLMTLKNQYPKAIIVPIRSIEAGGKNKLPIVLAEYISQKTGFEVDISIVQINRVHRTGTDEWYRFAFRPAYDGKIEAGRNYILVDDIFSLGGSFNELRRFIELHEGKVVQMIALATGRSGHEINPRNETLKSLIDKYGTDALSSFLKEINLYDGNFKALTEPEARAIRRTTSLDEARNRILAARCQRNTHLGTESSQQDEHQASRINPSEHTNQHRSRR